MTKTFIFTLHGRLILDKMQISNLITKGKIEEAIQILIDNQVDGAISLMGRFNRNKKDNLLGLLTRDQYDRENNKISHAILYYADEDTDNVTPDTTSNTSLEDVLLRISAENKRRNIPVYDECQIILKEYRDYKDTKATNSLFDVTGRRYKAIEAKAIELINRLKESKELSKEDFAARIEELLSEVIPTYDSLKEAYELACGRGFKNNWIEQQLNQRPSDADVRINITEEIEAFVAKL